MNAKKIMGAVLVALLAAALFVGAGAAEETAVGTVYLYQNTSLPTGLAAGTYTCGDAAVTIGSAVVPNDLSKFVNGGKYSNGTHYVVVKLPNVEFTAIGNAGSTPTYDAMANGLIAGQYINITPVVAAAPGAQVVKYILYDPSGNPTNFVDGDSQWQSGNLNLTISQKGVYQIQAVLDTTGSDAQIMPANLLYGQKYSFTVYSAEPTLTVSADTVIVNNFITVTVTGIPGHIINLTAPGFEINADNQTSAAVTPTVAGGADIAIPNTGSTVVYLKALTDTGKKTLVAYDSSLPVASQKNIKEEVKIIKGEITAQADADSFFVGNPIALSGTTTAGSKLFFYIEGTNFPFTQIQAAAVSEDLDVVDGKWTIELNSAAITSGTPAKKLVAGTYTVVVSTFDNISTPVAAQNLLKEAVMDVTYGTAAVTLTQPFLTGIEAAAVAIQDTDYFITGTAYSADYVYLYVFGTNFFTKQVVGTDDDETFEFEIDKTVTKDMAPGTYFYLIQHPMNDELFNVWADGVTPSLIAGDITNVGTPKPGSFYYAATTNPKANASFIFNVWERGTNYAAQALLDEIAGQNIDDVFVQGTFDVEAQKLTINPIPAEVAQGEKLAVSGTSNSGEGVEVIINVLAGTFGATIKGDENSATFLTQKAVTNEDGTFEAAIDTSKLEVGNYIVTVELNGQMYDSAAVEIVAAADKPDTPDTPDVPDTPDTPDTPTEPETPGFGALAALAGLGAVAVLLLRRE